MDLQWLETMGGPFVAMHERERHAWFGGYRYTDDASQAELALPDGGGLIADFMDPGERCLGLVWNGFRHVALP